MTPPKRFVQYLLCIRNDDVPLSLEVRKVYRQLRDSVAEEHGLVRVIDDTGNDYLFSKGWFVPLVLPARVRKALAKTEILRD